MGHEDNVYHRERERQCRSMAAMATDPEVRRRHEELAELHARHAGQVNSFGDLGELSVA
jgi:hypothetical protein